MPGFSVNWVFGATPLHQQRFCENLLGAKLFLGVVCAHFVSQKHTLRERGCTGPSEHGALLFPHSSPPFMGPIDKWTRGVSETISFRHFSSSLWPSENKLVSTRTFQSYPFLGNAHSQLCVRRVTPNRGTDGTRFLQPMGRMSIHLFWMNLKRHLQESGRGKPTKKKS